MGLVEKRETVMSKGTLLLVDDDRQVLEAMADWLRDQGYQLDVANGYQSALQAIGRKRYDLLLLDIRLRDGDGFDLLAHCREHHPGLIVILITGYGTADTAVEAVRAG